jgi:GDP-L-fucose synthase
MYRNIAPDVVIHAAATCGGIQSCSANPARFLYDNLTMNTEVLEGAREHNVEKFVAISSVCAYPLNVALPAVETDLWNGYPEATNAPYGIAKRVLLEQCAAYRKQYGMNCIGLVLANLHGPRDCFDAKRAHVIPSLIRKCMEEETLTVWGTGTVSREFLYVKDAAEAVVLATMRCEDSEPVNIATGVETSIRRVVDVVVEATNFKGKTIWDANLPEGQPRRLFDISKAERFGFKANTALEEGIKETVKWYKTQHFTHTCG